MVRTANQKRMNQQTMEIEPVNKCPLCGDKNSGTTLYKVTDILYGIQGTYCLQQCQNCGLIYLNPRPAPQAMSACYPEEYASYHPPIEQENFPLMRWMRRRKLSKRRHLIEKYSRQKPGRILDVGCSTGLFLHEMSQHGWQTMGIEPIHHAADFARKYFNLTIFQGTLLEYPDSTAMFDVVTFWDVLEHTYNPMEELNKASQLMKPGGLLVINIPNWNSLDRKLFGQYWQGFDPPRHLYMFTRSTLAEMLTKAKFEIITWLCFMPGYFSFAMSVERWLKATAPSISSPTAKISRLPGARLPFEPWFSFLNWIGNGPLISVFARKTTGE